MVFAAAVILVGASISARGAWVYDNSVNYQHSWLYSGFELGDQINLAGTDRTLTYFDFEYYGLNLDAGAQARVRFYQNDGPLTPSGFNAPGSLLFDSGLFAIVSPPNSDHRATLQFSDFTTDATVALTQPLPNTLTWTVEFSGVNTNLGQQAGLVIYSPPVVGSAYTDYWEQHGTEQSPDWRLLTNSFGPIDFGARFAAVPEPSSLALLSLGAIGLAGWLWRRARRSH